MGQIKRWAVAFAALGILAINLSGCVYVHNESWDDLTPMEKEGARHEYEIIKEEVKDDFLEDSLAGDLVSKIFEELDRILSI